MITTYVNLKNVDGATYGKDINTLVKVTGDREVTQEDMQKVDKCLDNLWKETEDFIVPDNATCVQAAVETLEALGFECEVIKAEYEVEW